MRAIEFITENTKFIIDPVYDSYYGEDDDYHPMKYVNVYVDKVDRMWAKDDLYVGKGGAGGIGNRYDRFGEWLTTTNEPVKASSIAVKKDGSIAFDNGRHRFAWFRDHGYDVLPVSMDDKSFRLAKEFGIIAQ